MKLVGAMTVILAATTCKANGMLTTLKPFVTVTSGAELTLNAGRSNNFPPNATSLSYYDYAVHQSPAFSFIYGGAIGIETELSWVWALQFDIGYYANNGFSVNGIVTQGIDIASQDQYGYSYSIQTQQLLLESKLLYHIRCYHPYILLGLGSAWNDTKGFAVNINPPFTTFSNQFSSNTVTSFTYDIGFGMDVDLRENTRLGIGYRFSDFGLAKTSKGVINQTTTNNTFSQSHLYVHEALVQITQLF